ncbi:ABC transporter permease [Corynebacterium mastitidis]|uniref:ABC transporter permease n=1 Tax=Corynebacterium mastitidis TaxID=161890 RepID=UPI000370E618|nr:ABC transporter permease subunit [Corynebacterium mastitidis]
MNFLLDALTWLADPAQWNAASGIPARLTQHVALTVAAVALACAAALPLGMALGHTGRWAGLVGAITGAARAIPTLGLITVFGLALGIGYAAPLWALVVLAVPSILAGAYSGVQAIDRDVLAASRALGMSTRQLVLRVELPLALPLIIGGLRAATLQVVSTATLAAYVSDYGLGRYLFTGLKTRDYTQMLGGALLVIAVALLFEALLAAAQRLARTRLADPASRTK